MKSDKEFIGELMVSQQYVHRAAEWLVRRGVNAMVRPTIIRPDFESRGDFIDDGDIAALMTFETKHRYLDFTSAEDYPYPTVIVDEVWKVDRRKGWGVIGYNIINHAMTHVAFVPMRTKEHWLKSSCYDKKDRQERVNYVCPKEMCVFFDMRK